MEFSIEKTVRQGAMCIAVSPDGSRAAVSSERSVGIYTLPELKREGSFRLSNPGTMVFLSDSRSLLILNTTGVLYLWDGTELERLGDWQVPEWYENPLHYIGEDTVLWAAVGGVWRYHLPGRTMTRLYETERNVQLGPVENGVVRFAECKRSYIGLHPIDFVTMTTEGEVLSRVTTREKLPECFWPGCWTEDGSFVYGAQLIPQNLTGLREEGCIFHVDTRSGEVRVRKSVDLYSMNTGFSFGRGMVIQSSHALQKDIIFRDPGSLEELGRIEYNAMLGKLDLNPLEEVVFLDDDTFLLGSWNRLFRMGMER